MHDDAGPDGWEHCTTRDAGVIREALGVGYVREARVLHKVQRGIDAAAEPLLDDATTAICRGRRWAVQLARFIQLLDDAKPAGVRLDALGIDFALAWADLRTHPEQRAAFMCIAEVQAELVARTFVGIDPATANNVGARSIDKIALFGALYGMSAPQLRDQLVGLNPALVGHHRAAAERQLTIEQYERTAEAMRATTRQLTIEQYERTAEAMRATTQAQLDAQPVYRWLRDHYGSDG